MAPAITTKDIFNEAQESFLRSLSPRERTLYSTCSSADELLTEAQQLEIISKNRTRGRLFMQRITGLSKALAPYFDVVGIVVQSTEYAALAWGGIRLVLQLASNFSTFFDKLTRFLERLTKHFPQYDLIMRMYKGRYLDDFVKLIMDSLREVYVDIFQFLQRVAWVFSGKDGKNKPRPVIIASLAWQPFDSRFEEILERMEFNRNMLKDLLDLDHKRANFDAMQKLQDELGAAKSERDDAGKARHNQGNAAQKAETERQKQQEDRTEAEISRLSQLENKISQAREIRAAEDARVEAQRAEETLGKIKEELFQAKRDVLILRIRDWLSPPEFAQDYEKALNHREQDTAQWLLDDTRFEDWRSCTPTPSDQSKFAQECLWIKGNPGYGKTVLAANALSELEDDAEDNLSQNSTGTPEILYFFFRSGTSTMNSSAAAYRALLAQILHAHRNDNDIIDKFIFSMNETSSGQMIASDDELGELLRIYTRCSDKQCFIVLDGIDECIENETLVQQLLRLKQESDIKILLFSRPNVGSLSRTVATEQQLLIGRNTSGDIKIYLTRKLALLQDGGFLPRSLKAESLITHLLIGADGMFLWARLMISYLKCPALTRAQRVEVIENVILPEGLEAMYDRIGDLIGKGYQIQRDLAKKIIMWLTFTERRITTRELQVAIAISADSAWSQKEAADLEEFTEMVLMTCAGLVETEILYSPLHERFSTFFRFIHLSASEYFSRETGHFSSIFSTTAWEANLEITSACLKFLTTELPAQSLCITLGANSAKEFVNYAFPFCNYAALYWIPHLEATQYDIQYEMSVSHNGHSIKNQLHQLLLQLSAFMSQGLLLLSWIEAIYIFEQPPPFERLKRWLSWARGLIKLKFPDDIDLPRLCDDVAELVRFLPQLHEYWGPKLITTPGCIWEDVTAFTPSRLLPQSSATIVQSLITEEPESDYLSTQYLCKVSESTSDGLLVGVLSIWPSRKFQVFTQQRKKTVSLRTLRDLSTGWIARYEIWSLSSDARCTIDHRFLLDNTEVWLQLKQTMCQNESGSWGVQFPLAISKNARMFTVLRTLFSMKPATTKPGLVLESSILSLDFDGIKSPHWSPQHDKIANDDALFSSSELDADERFQRRDLYLYWFFFHPNSRSLLFVSQDLQKRSMTGVFDLKAAPEVAILNHGVLNVTGNLLRHPSWCRNFNQVKVIYHSQYPLLAFSFAGRIYLWAFSNSAEKPLPFGEIDPDSEISFNPKGGGIIFSDPLDGRTIVKPIPHHLLQSQQLMVTLNPVSTDLSVRKWAKNTNWRSPSPSIRDLQRLRPSTPSLNEGQSLFQAYHSQDNNLSVRLRGSTDIAQGSRELSKLPSWAGSEQANISLHVPENRDEMIKVVLNKAAKPWYGMSDEVDTHLPAIMQRDSRSLELPRLVGREGERGKGVIEDGNVD